MKKPTYAFEGFALDAQRRVLSRPGGAPILLPPKALDTLLYLVERPGELIDKRTLLDAIWPDVVVEENNLNHGYGRIGKDEKARKLFDEVQHSGGPVSDSTLALAHLAIGNRAQSLQHLDRAIEKLKRHQPDAGWFNLMMFKHNLTGDPRLNEPDFRLRREQMVGS